MSIRQHIPPMISGFVGATIAVSLMGGAAYAATGGTFILGKSNSASTTTSLTNSSGTALALTSKSGTAPLRVSNGTKVALLNADRIDGLDSTSFARAGAAFSWATPAGAAVVDDWDGDQVDDSAYSIATCPAGTSVVSGGGVQDTGATTDAGTTLYSGPSGSNGWVLQTAGTTSNPVAFAICFNGKTTTPAGLQPTK